MHPLPDVSVSINAYGNELFFFFFFFVPLIYFILFISFFSYFHDYRIQIQILEILFLQAILPRRDRAESQEQAGRAGLQRLVWELRALRHLVSLRGGKQPPGGDSQEDCRNAEPSQLPYNGTGRGCAQYQTSTVRASQDHWLVPPPPSHLIRYAVTDIVLYHDVGDNADSVDGMEFCQKFFSTLAFMLSLLE